MGSAAHTHGPARVRPATGRSSGSWCVVAPVRTPSPWPAGSVPAGKPPALSRSPRSLSHQTQRAGPGAGHAGHASPHPATRPRRLTFRLPAQRALRLCGERETGGHSGARVTAPPRTRKRPAAALAAWRVLRAGARSFRAQDTRIPHCAAEHTHSAVASVPRPAFDGNSVTNDEQKRDVPFQQNL